MGILIHLPSHLYLISINCGLSKFPPIESRDNRGRRFFIACKFLIDVLIYHKILKRVEIASEATESLIFYLIKCLKFSRNYYIYELRKLRRLENLS